MSDILSARRFRASSAKARLTKLGTLGVRQCPELRFSTRVWWTSRDAHQVGADMQSPMDIGWGDCELAKRDGIAGKSKWLSPSNHRRKIGNDSVILVHTEVLGLSTKQTWRRSTEVNNPDPVRQSCFLVVTPQENYHLFWKAALEYLKFPEIWAKTHFHQSVSDWCQSRILLINTTQTPPLLVKKDHVVGSKGMPETISP